MRTKYVILSIILPSMVFLDQLTKILAKSYLRPLLVELDPQQRYSTLIDGFFRFKYAENPGAAFGLGASWSPNLRVTFFIVVSLLAVIFVGYMFRKIEDDQKRLAASFALVLSGAIGNLIDRIYMNKVVDFIDWYVTFDEPTNFLFFTARAGEHHWPTFNIADICISIGVALLAIEIIFGKGLQDNKEEDPKEEQKADEGGG
jgi:signal peptidase II